MQVISIAKGFYYLSKRDWPDLTEKERNKQRAVLLLRQTKQPLMVCGLFDISKATLYRWHNSVDLKDPSALKGEVPVAQKGENAVVDPSSSATVLDPTNPLGSSPR